MAMYMSELFLTLVLSGWVFASDGETKQHVNVKNGANVDLTCTVARDATVLLLVWIRPDLKADGYVFFYRDGRQYKKFEIPSFAGRVSNPVINGGNITVQLRNVTTNDNGTYECHVTESGTGRSRRASTEVKNVIELTVTESGGGAGHTEDGGDKDGGDKDGGGKDGGNKDRGHVGLTSVLVPIVVSAFIGVWIIHFKRAMKKSSSPPPPPPDKATVVQLL